MCVCVCVRARARVCVRACVRVCACVLILCTLRQSPDVNKPLGPIMHHFGNLYPEDLGSCHENQNGGRKATKSIAWIVVKSLLFPRINCLKYKKEEVIDIIDPSARSCSAKLVYFQGFSFLIWSAQSNVLSRSDI